MKKTVDIFFDANISHYFAEGLNKIQEPLNSRSKTHNLNVIALENAFSRDVKDEVWIPQLGAKQSCVLTFDARISKNPQQKKLFWDSKIGLFLLKPPSKNNFDYWQTVEICIKHWIKINKIVCEESRPFLYEITQRGGLKKYSF